MVKKVNIKNKNKNVINIKINTDKPKKAPRKRRQPNKKIPPGERGGVSSFSYGANQPPVVIQYQQPTQQAKTETINETATVPQSLSEQLENAQKIIKSHILGTNKINEKIKYVDDENETKDDLEPTKKQLTFKKPKILKRVAKPDTTTQRFSVGQISSPAPIEAQSPIFSPSMDNQGNIIQTQGTPSIVKSLKNQIETKEKINNTPAAKPATKKTSKTAAKSTDTPNNSIFSYVGFGRTKVIPEMEALFPNTEQSKNITMRNNPALNDIILSSPP